MMVASLSDCRELFALSGWGDTEWSYYCDEAHDDTPALNLSEPLKVVGGVGYYDHRYPAYDLGYLVRKLPVHYLQKFGNESYVARWVYPAPTREQIELGTHHIIGHSRTSPENALCRLAVNLFEAGVLMARSAG
jgi:hypothetical protein